AEERARLRRERLALGPVGVPAHGVVNPAAGFPPQGAMLPPGLVPAVADSMPQRFVPTGYGQPPPVSGPSYGPPAYGYASAPPGPALPPPGYGQPPPGYGQPPLGYGQPLPYGAVPYVASPYGPQPYQLVMVPPRIRWSRRQRTAAVLSSWV